jgi:hypothetical protein
MKLSKCALLLIPAIGLSGCLKVEDKNNDAVIAALDAQTKELAKQNQELAKQGESSKFITLNGIVRPFTSDVDLSKAQVRVLVGNALSAPVPVVDGKYSIAKIPVLSDIAIIVESTNNTFVTRVFPMRTTSGSDTSIRQINPIDVAKPITYSFEILDIGNGQPLTVPNLQVASSLRDSAHDLSAYIPKVTFDATTQRYSVTVGANDTVQIIGKADIDADGFKDFNLSPFEGSNAVFLAFNDVKNGYVYVQKTPLVYSEIDVELTLVDEVNNSPIVAPQLLVQSADGKERLMNSDAAGLFSFKAKLYRHSSGNYTNYISIPNFTFKNTQFSGTMVSVSPNGQKLEVNGRAVELTNNKLAIVMPMAREVQDTIEPQLLNQRIYNNELSMVFNSPVNSEQLKVSIRDRNGVEFLFGKDQFGNSTPGTSTVINKPTMVVPISNGMNDLVLKANFSTLLNTMNDPILEITGFVTTKTAPFGKTRLQETQRLATVETPITSDTVIVDNKNYLKQGVPVFARSSNDLDAMPSIWQVNRQLTVILSGIHDRKENFQVKIVKNGKTLCQNMMYNLSRNSFISIPAKNETITFNEYNSTTILGGFSENYFGRYTDCYTDQFENDSTDANPNMVTVNYSYTDATTNKQVTGAVTVPVR